MSYRECAFLVRVRVREQAKEEEEQRKKEQSLTSKFMKMGEKATGWTMVRLICSSISTCMYT